MKLIIAFLLAIGILLSVLPIIGLLRLKDRSTAQYILLVFWVLVLNIIVHYYATLHDLSVLQFVTNFLQDGVWFLIPPLLYVYVKSIFVRQSKFAQKNVKHFAVFFIYLFDYSMPKSINPDTQYINGIDQYIPNCPIIQAIFGMVYFLMALRLFYKFRKLMRYNYPDIGETGFLWLERFLIGFLLVLVVDLGIVITEMIIGPHADWLPYVPIVFLVLVIGYLGYDGLTNPSVFLPQFLIENRVSQRKSRPPSNSYLKLSEQESLTKRFNHCMREEKLYLLQELNSKALAKAMKTSERKLSAFFNEVMDSNFYDTINAFRVEEAKQILQSDALKNQSITGIALSCGFRSKSSFYRIFKKSTNLSPTDYLKMVEKASHHP